ncbi:phytanoyl-CoA dioxygenase family protein [Phytoactinopolyspora halotolerans]|uniref:Phytanoyl-CoA dioxygenase family protein n=1 Tax=Phytoactinopolyspora halotolerans TaxID=1981512 RepID=A0A6L9S820_9ACTN|nr:phytanoyl-CoA dioxygenase family protein [Phytoactinopolyspora halotolerans]NEE01187.1 hypothetical protein [Phytoactinopolyspora halotolerans]
MGSELLLDGIAVMRRVIQPPSMNVTELLRRNALERGGWKSTKKLHIEDLSPFEEELCKILFSRRLREVADDALAGEATYLGARYRAPLPGYGEQTMHPDDADVTRSVVRLVTAIIPLVAFTPLSGTTRFLPQSHLQRPRHVPEDPAVVCPGQLLVEAEPGDAIMFTGGLWHSGTRNQTATPRDAISISFIRQDQWQ